METASLLIANSERLERARGRSERPQECPHGDVPRNDTKGPIEVAATQRGVDMRPGHDRGTRFPPKRHSKDVTNRVGSDLQPCLVKPAHVAVHSGLPGCRVDESLHATVGMATELSHLVEARRDFLAVDHDV